MSWTAEMRKFGSNDEWEGNDARFALRVDAVQYGEGLNAHWPMRELRVIESDKPPNCRLDNGTVKYVWEK
jgi:hypothetical protein